MPVRRLQQIDVLKGLAALAVVATHSLSVSELIGSWAVLHIWQAVPLFVVLLAVNASLSFQRRGASNPASLLTADYVRRRAVRVLAPFGFVWIAALVIGLSDGDVYLGVETWVLRLPHPGPGNYYIPLVVALLLIAPLVYAAYRKRPGVTLVALFACDIVFQVLAARLPLLTAHPFAYSIAFPRYLAVFALGFLIADDNVDERVKWAVLGSGAVLSLLYLYIGNTGGWSPPFVPTWRTQNVLAAFYPAMLAAAGIRFLPKTSTGRVCRGLALVGRASYHVFLAQMVYFMVVPQSDSALLVQNLVVCTGAGIGFYVLELAVRSRWGQRGTPVASA